MNAAIRCAAGISLGLWAGWLSTAALAAEPVATSSAVATVAAAGAVTGQAVTTTSPAQDAKAATQKADTKAVTKPTTAQAGKKTAQPAVALDSSGASFANPTNNQLWRSHVNFGTVSRVDPYTGQLHVQIPLIDIPENDGLHFQIGLVLVDNSGQEQFEFYPAFTNTSTQTSCFWIICNSSIARTFTGPNGSPHVLHLTSSNGEWTYYASKDHWMASIHTDPDTHDWTGYVHSPNGVQYVTAGPTVIQIISKNGGTVINFGNGPQGWTSASINNGLNVDISPGSSITMNNSTWKFNGNPINSITLPDGQSWQFQWQNNVLQLTYPSGLTSQFTLAPDLSPNNTSGNNNQQNPLAATHAWYGYYPVTQETDSGPGIPTTTTTFNYVDVNNTRTTTVTNPYFKAVYVYNNNPIIGCFEWWGGGSNICMLAYTWGQFSQDSGLIQSKSLYSASGQLLQTTQYSWVQATNPLTQDFSSPLCSEGNSDEGWVVVPCDGGGNPLNIYLPQTITTTRDGTTYTTTYSNYDNYYFPQTITQTGQGNTLTTQYTYYENPSKWIFEPQNATTTDGSGNVVNTVIRNFDGNGNLTSKTVNGVTTQFTYDNAGDLRSVTNALNQTSSFGNYVAGKPETIVDALGHITVFTILPDGTITRYIDALGNTYYFNYDNMFRLTQIQFPKGDPINITWNTAGQNTEQITRDDFQKTIFNDAKAQPIETIDKDTNTGAQRIVYQNYDGLGRSVFTSYPQSSANANPFGIATSYDALNRVTSVTTAAQQAVGRGY